jgi:hypothetical protein
MQRFSFGRLLLVPLTLMAVSASAQVISVDTTTFWKKKIGFGANFSQAAFSENWTGGGVNSIGLSGFFNYKANYKKNRTSWDNEIDLLYGFVNNEGQGFRKTIDRIYLDSKVGHAITPKWDFSGSLNFLSQFNNGFKYEKDANGVEQEFLISDFMAPAFITAGIGVEYHPVDYFKIRINPVAPRITLVNDPVRFVSTVGEKPYGVDTTKNARFEWFALQVMADFNKDIAKNLNLKWRYMMYANYETFSFQEIDHRLDITLTAKVNKFVNVNIGGILLYDFDQIDEVQYSQSFNLGFQYTFQNFEEKK